MEYAITYLRQLDGHVTIPGMNIIDDLRIPHLKPLISPAILIEEFLPTETSIRTVVQARTGAQEIIHGQDDRLLVIVGPCSIHDIESATEYGQRLATLIQQHKNELCILMRVYFEKPRSISGWKGLIKDPDLDESYNVNQGLRMARKLLLDLTSYQVPCATEFLDTIVPQFISDLISWGAIGARTAESPIHRDFASGLPMPVGFKNGTGGKALIAIDAIRAAAHPQHFLSINKMGMAAIVSTTGNKDSHIILRGGSKGVNFDAASIQEVTKKLRSFNLNESVMVDCSHGNSLKDHTKQHIALRDVARQISEGSQSIMGVMLESHLQAGKQELTAKETLKYGQSITDACIDFEETEILLEELALAVKKRREFNV